ncbi:uncharacterized protein LOC124909598 [Impatiens glandulifera]|uniref:uncharacterized protein LOC124909598 n=1 Tax=Impatiens glandulifera TaxID=253017 RepID=UPI001FB16531|nr:uncharacterized protein LOC124909598 [Impatiens glandulifera]
MVNIRLAMVYGSNSKRDFNVVKFGYERSPEADTSQAMIDFNDCIRDIGCIEPTNVGNAFTWSSMRGNEDMRKSRIDRGLINEDWTLRFPKSRIQVLNPGISDHCPIMLFWDKEERIKRSFKFFNFWMVSDKFKIILKEVWSKQVSESKMFQKRMLGDEVSQSLVQEEKEAITKFRALSSLEESHIKQKKCSTRNLRNRVNRIKTSDGVIVQGQQLVHDEAIQFYRDLIGTRKESTSHIHFLHQILTKKVTMEESCRIIEVVRFPIIVIDWIWQCISTPHFIISVNGVHDGYFNGENGVRQRDPLSSYLFALIMGIFESVLKMLRKNLPYINHSQCREEDITHICFADDLFIMAHADVDSIKTIKEALTIFSSVTCLVINEGKSLVFYGGVKEETKASIFDIMGIQEGTLPVRYLGIPLSTKQLHISHCRSLIEKVKNSMNGWATKRLSYAGRTELVTKVIMRIIGYWAQQIILPKKVMKALDCLMRNFIWGNQGRAGKKVKWDDVWKSKEEGWIGMKNCIEWNKALTIRHFWALKKKQDSLWVRWVHSRFMKNEKSIWTSKIKLEMTWSLKKILKFKDIAISLFDIRLGNGRGTLFWYDPWFENLPIILETEFCGMRIRRDYLNSSVRDIWDEDYNTLLRCIPEGVRILSFMQTIHFSDNIDSRLWKVERDGKFNSNLAWESIRERGNVVGWTHAVWSSKIILRQQFVLWLLFRKRLSTRDRLKRFMNIPDSKCLFCDDNEETIDRLFGGCLFTLELWRRFTKAMELVFSPQIGLISRRWSS